VFVVRPAAFVRAAGCFTSAEPNSQIFAGKSGAEGPVREIPMRMRRRLTTCGCCLPCAPHHLRLLLAMHRRLRLVAAATILCVVMDMRIISPWNL
jgi:hypothetical protein